MPLFSKKLSSKRINVDRIKKGADAKVKKLKKFMANKKTNIFYWLLKIRSP
jgi:hypothetical protein